MTRCARMLIAWLLFAATLASAVSAIAQDMRPIDSGLPRWTSEELEQFITAADLADTPTADQVRAAHAALAAGHTRGRAEMRESYRLMSERRMQWHRDNPNGPDPMQEFGEDFGNAEIYWTWVEGFEQREAQFLTEVGSALEGDAATVFTRWKHDLNRKHTLAHVRDGWAYLSGSRSLMNLSEILDSIGLSEEARRELSDAEEAYAQAMHAAIDGFYCWEVEQGRTWRTNYIPRRERGTPVAERKRAALVDLFHEQGARIRRIATVNEQHIAILRARLPDREAIAFQDAVDRARHPVVFRPCPVEIAITRLRELRGITPEQLAAAEQAWDDYAARRDALRRRIVLAFDRWESPERMARREARRIEQTITEEALPPEPDAADHPAIPLMQRSMDLAKQGAMDLATALGGAEAVARLPLDIRLALHWFETDPQPKR